MDAGPGTDLGGLGWFLGIWVTMMAAMMLPSVSPMVLAFARVTQGALAARAGGVRPDLGLRRRATSRRGPPTGSSPTASSGSSSPSPATCSPGIARGRTSPAERSSRRASTS